MIDPTNDNAVAFFFVILDTVYTYRALATLHGDHGYLQLQRRVAPNKPTSGPRRIALYLYMQSYINSLKTPVGGGLRGVFQRSKLCRTKFELDFCCSNSAASIID